MRWLLILAASSGCWAQSLSFACADSTDSRCVTSGSTVNITFNQVEGNVNDYGIQVNATASGTWTLGAIPQICPPPPFYGYPAAQVFNQGTGTQITTNISANTEISILAINSGYTLPTFQCPVGTYTYQIPWTNGATTVNINVTQNILLRRAAPVNINGFGIPDYQLASAHGFTQDGIYPPSGYTFDYNSFPCSPSCDPNVTAPVTLGHTWTDELNNVWTVATGSPCNVQEAGKAPMSVADTYVICSDPNGVLHIYYANGSGLYCNILATGAGGQIATNYDYYWSPISDNVIYFVGSSGVFGATTGASAIYKITLTGGGGGCTTAAAYDFSSYGRYNTGSGGHVSGTRDGWIPFNTFKDYSMSVTISGTSLTWNSGTPLDSNLTGQVLQSAGGGGAIGATFVSVNVSAHTAVLSATPSCTGTCSVSVAVPYNWGMLKDQGSGTAYTIVAGNVQTNPVSILNSSNIGNGGPGPFPSEDLDGNIWLVGASSNGVFDFSMYFNPNTDTQQHFTTGTAYFGNAFNRTCNANAAVNYGGGIPSVECPVAQHQSTSMFADGSAWQCMSENPNGLPGQGCLQYRHVGNPSTPTDTVVPMYTKYFGTELGQAEGTFSGGITPEWNVSVGAKNQPTAYQITGCTNATPTVCTVGSTSFSPGMLTAADAAAFVASGARMGNIPCLTGVQPVSSAPSGGNTITFTHGCSGGFSPSGFSFYGYAMADLQSVGGSSIIDYTGGDVDTTRVCRDVVVCYRFGHSRSLAMLDGVVDSYYGLPRANVSMDGTKVILSTNFGMPYGTRLAVAPLPFSGGGAGLPSTCLDVTHCVVALTAANTLTLSVITPTTGTAIFEIGTSQRWTDLQMANDPSGTCTTVGEAALSMASGKAFTCSGFNSYNWAAGDPDTTYQVQVVAPGAAAKLATFSGLRSGATYYWRLIADFKTVAWGSTAPGASGNVNAILAGVLNGVLQ